MNCYRCNSPVVENSCQCKDGITIVHGDCLEVLPELASDSFSCGVTDPPWKAGNGGRIHRKEGEKLHSVAPSRESRSLAYGDIGFFSSTVITQLCRICASDVLVLCGFIELPEVINSVEKYRGILVWHNTRPTPIPGPLAKRDAAFIVWAGKRTSIKNNENWPSCIFSFPSPQGGCMAKERIRNTDGSTAHPAQEPLSLFLALMNPLSGSVLEPYCGSGTTLVAAKQLARRALGIEIAERYCEIAANRLRQEVLPFE